MKSGIAIGGNIIIISTDRGRYNIQGDLTGISEKRNDFCFNSFSFILFTYTCVTQKV